MLGNLFNSINNTIGSASNGFGAMTAGSDGGMTDRSSENAENLSDATGAADSKVTNAGRESVKVQAENAVQSMVQKADINHMNNVSQNVGSISY
ncbi:hypothetical protein GIW45_16940 [Pseudomonas congelans]|uniref:hypothetical protein n=1 Tax=Pseudomonas congelans TaxID=200452 RepID=UPI001F355ABB|nr:hypothetical protein [Pseudomonas congelans]MCF5165712.1 hypothetical protein [Pseudomonas congelans]